MKKCPNCGTEMNDDCMFCLTCGARCDGNVGAAPIPNQISADPTDHTAEFSPEEVHENKVWALLCYCGFLFVLPLIGAQNSRYVQFHLRENLKYMICYSLLSVATILLSWTIIVPCVTPIAMVVLSVVRIIGFFSACKGNSKELPILKSFKFFN